VARQVGLGFLLYLNPPIEVPVYSATGEVQGNVRLPDVYRVPVRKDLIHRVFMSEFTAAIQPKGRDPMAGMRTTAVSLGIHHGLARPYLPGHCSHPLLALEAHKGYRWLSHAHL